MQLTARPAKLLLQRLLLLQLSLLLPQRCGGALCTGMGGELKGQRYAYLRGIVIINERPPRGPTNIYNCAGAC